MIVLTVISFNGTPSSGPSASFDELGGSIGRADHNQLVLPDPERTISRVHARILYRSGGYTIVDNGSNPISVNGRPAGAGVELPLRPGDQIEIGGYKLAVGDGAAARSEDPFASLFGDGLAGEGQPARAAPPPVVPPPAAPARPAAPMPPPAPPRAAAGPTALPDDWDPFAPDTGQAGLAAAAGEEMPGGGLTGFVPPAPSEASLDDLFGLGSGPTPADPLAAMTPAAPATPLPDPLRALARPAPPPVTAGDLGSDLNTPMPLPPARRPLGAGTPSGAVFSWDDTPVRTEPSVQRPAPPAAVRRPEPARPPAAAAARAPAGAVADDALRAAFLEGLGMPGLPLAALDESTLRLVGQLLRESTRGTVELLVARAALKREMRADVTMIAARQNNPLKFSPTVEVALQHLLGPPVGGFMPAGQAMRDAYDDLRAHQLGVMAGMRAALDGVLQRFDPAQLEAKLLRRSSITNLIPAARKARLWELFQELFTQLQGEAQDDFDDLFGKAFLRAYEEQLDRLQREPGPGP